MQPAVHWTPSALDARKVLSDERFAAYESAVPGRSTAAALALYEWNIDAAQCQGAIERAHRTSVANVPPGAVISALSLGFWVDLLDAGGYVGKPPTRRRCDYETTLWRPALHRAFSAPEHGLRKPTHRDVDRLRLLRNRLAHHEPLFDGVPDRYSPGRLSLVNLAHLTGAVLNSINPRAELWRRSHSTVNATLAARPALTPRHQRRP